jgi:formylglycine-generating enzyme required for sulfatase activity
MYLSLFHGKSTLNGYSGFIPYSSDYIRAVFADFPSWGAIDILQKLNVKFAASGTKFDLPTEAQWEYACRAGGKGKFSFGDAERLLAEYAWFKGNAGDKTHPVGEKKPNAWGLYDMHGNVCEWCADWYQRSYYQESPPADPTCADPSYHRVIRGGCFDDAASSCRAAFRSMNDPSDRNHNVGLRVMCFNDSK